MYLYKTIKNFLIDKDYYIDIWQQNIHVYGFIKIDVLQETKASFQFDEFSLEIIGCSFRVLKLTKNEVLLQGKIKEVKFT